ncbi:MAG: hypothetical protein JXL20_05535 [Deltaproteobacteria bacterium]|nr:hypothetical protein [Deltaproteobacteria bacterium]MBN2783802.1 hypothetical protein [Pontiellaceae bacterium]
MKMRLLLTGVVLGALLAPLSCCALMSIAEIHLGQAQELGVEVRTTPAGDDTLWIELEVKTDGTLENFDHVSMAIKQDGRTLVSYVQLREKRLDADRVSVRFLANRCYVDKITLRIVAGTPMNRVGYDVKLNDFIDLEKGDKAERSEK